MGGFLNERESQPRTLGIPKRAKRIGGGFGFMIILKEGESGRKESLEFSTRFAAC